MIFIIGFFLMIGKEGTVLDSHFNSYKVKYDMLNHFIQPIVRAQYIHSMNMFINLDDLYHLMHNPLVNQEFQVCGEDAPKQLISNTFNLLGHYRYWCIKNHCDCKVYGIYTSTIRSFKNNVYLPDYRKKFKLIYSDENAAYYFVNHAIKYGLSLLEIISKYIPDVYIVDSKYLEPSMIPLYIAEEVQPADWNILITRDPYDIQYSYRNKWSVIAPIGDRSQFVGSKGIWDYVNLRERVYTKSEDTVSLDYPSSLYILARAVVGDKYRSIPRLRKIGWKTLFKYLDEIMKENPSANDITLKLKLIEKVKGKSSLSNEEINANLNSINVDLQRESMLELDKTLITTQLVDYPDYENLQELNRIQFLKYPLNLQFLCNTSAIHGPITPFD